MTDQITESSGNEIFRKALHPEEVKLYAAQAARIKELEEALKPFAEMCERNVKPTKPDGDGCEIVMSCREMRRARDVLKKGKPE